jgi:MiaB/RimO family radical SAM methylthiotransferase
MKTFSVETLGCKVNHYESEQVAALLRSAGLVEADAAHADLRVVNTCSVTVEAASKSRQTTRRLVRLPVLPSVPHFGAAAGDETADIRGETDRRHSTEIPTAVPTGAPAPVPTHAAGPSGDAADPAIERRRPRVIVTGCWATSDPDEAARLPGVDAVITHQSDVAAELNRLLKLWREEQRGVRQAPADSPIKPLLESSAEPLAEPPPEGFGNDGWMNEAGTPAGVRTAGSKAETSGKVNLQIYALSVDPGPENLPVPPENFSRGTVGLPLLGERQTGRQRAFLKVQDGCDAHCTYCIIPRLRPTPWSKPIEDAVEEARRLVGAGHVEIVLTGVFLGAYGFDTALRRRRSDSAREPLAELIASLCTGVKGLRRLRLSSLEPGDLTDELLAVLRAHPQVVPHFHLPLQSGSDALLRRMNRQYGRDDFLRMVDRVHGAYDEPALTTDIIVGFQGETEQEFERTVEVVDHAKFIHVHAFPYSPRPGTAAARWKGRMNGRVVKERISLLRERAGVHSLDFRGRFTRRTVEVLVEHDPESKGPIRHGRCERYFDVEFTAPEVRPGDFVRVRVDEVTAERTRGTCLSVERPARGVA